MGDLSKGVLDDGSQRIVVEMVVVDLGSEEELPFGLELLVQATSTATAGGCRRASSSGVWRVA